MKTAERTKSKTFFQLPKLNNTNTLLQPKLQRNMSEQSKTNKFDLSAKAYGIYNFNLQPIKDFNSNSRREIASLTKIATLILSLKIGKRFNLDNKNTYFRVSTNASQVSGTSAQLEPKQWLTVQDLFYGLMLPSGNDAATVLAENFGAFLYYQRLGQKSVLQSVKSLDVTEDYWNLKLYTEAFVKNMNLLAKQYRMKDTFFVNPHGLDSVFRLEAYSTVQDMAVITKKLLQFQQALPIISCKSYKTELKITCGNGKQIDSRSIVWNNTNRLLQKEGYVGAKTGQTVNAGNCLSTIYQNKRGQRYIIVVLGCSNRQARFLETEYLVKNFI